MNQPITIAGAITTSHCTVSTSIDSGLWDDMVAMSTAELATLGILIGKPWRDYLKHTSSMDLSSGKLRWLAVRILWGAFQDVDVTLPLLR